MEDGRDELLSPEVSLARSGGISESTRRRWVRAGRYPKPVVLARDRRGKAVRVAWVAAEVAEWVAHVITADRAERTA